MAFGGWTAPIQRRAKTEVTELYTHSKLSLVSSTEMTYLFRGFSAKAAPRFGVKLKDFRSKTIKTKETPRHLIRGASVGRLCEWYQCVYVYITYRVRERRREALCTLSQRSPKPGSHNVTSYAGEAASCVGVTGIAISASWQATWQTAPIGLAGISTSS